MRRLGADRRFLAVVVVAVVTVIALLTVILGGGTRQNLGPPSGPVPGATVTEVLRKAAATVARQPVPHPRAGQWVYLKSLVDDRIAGGGPKPQEYWFKYADPELERVKGGDDYSKRTFFRFLAELPADPDQVLERARRFWPDPGAGTAQHDYHALSELL